LQDVERDSGTVVGVYAFVGDQNVRVKQMVLQRVDDDFRVGWDPSRPRVAVGGNVDATVSTVKSIDECRVRSRIVESGSVEGDAFGVG
jgi:hypothetical protein